MCLSHICLLVSTKCKGHPISHHRVWYHTISQHYPCIRCTGIILTPYATLVPNFISFTASIAELAHGKNSNTHTINNSVTHSPTLFDATGSEAFTLKYISNIIVVDIAVPAKESTNLLLLLLIKLRQSHQTFQWLDKLQSARDTEARLVVEISRQHPRAAG